MTTARTSRVVGPQSGLTRLLLAVAAGLVAAVGLTSNTLADGTPVVDQTFDNREGSHRTVSATGTIDHDNPFFEDLGTNGRRCVTCHQSSEGWSITASGVQARFAASNGIDPIFRTVDGSNCASDDTSTFGRRRSAYGLLLERGVIRVDIDVPAQAEFLIESVDDPHGCGAPLTGASMFRRPLPTANLAFLSTVMWDGRDTIAGHAIRDGLLAQAREAPIRHAAGAPPPPAQVNAIVDFELGLFTAQLRDRRAGSLGERTARGGPRPLAHEPFCVGLNDPLGMLPAMPGACRVASGFDPRVFTLFGGWTTAPSPERQAIARGEAIFNTRQFVIADVPGLNGNARDPVRGPLTGTCTVCHDTPNAGNHSVSLPLDIGIADVKRRAPNVPLYTLRHLQTGDTVQTTDPGRAMVTGRWDDIGKFKGPVLRALAARPPYFHDGSAASLEDAIAFYDTRFSIGFTAREKADLLAFLRAL
jgi:hypothetical protein